MDISLFQLLSPWRTGRPWDTPHIERSVTKKIETWIDEPEILKKPWGHCLICGLEVSICL